jgi:PAS domain-containing protein
VDRNEIAKLSRHLQEFALPRAVADLTEQQFLAWNRAFLERTGYSEEELRALRPGQVLIQSEQPSFPGEAAGDHLSANFYAIAVRTTKDEAALPGHLMKSNHNLGYLMLEELKPEFPGKFEQGRLVGKEQERVRITQIFHEELAPSLMAVVFNLELLELKLEAAGSPHLRQAIKAAQLLSETTEKITETLKG